MYNPQFTTFISVAENGSFTKAANALFLTPTAVMKQINLLEAQLGITLFLRTNHGLRLTDAGTSFLQDAIYIRDYTQRAIAKAKEIDGKDKQPSIRFGASIMTPAKFLLDVWDDILRFNPRLKIELIPFENTMANSLEILKNLGKHIDITAGLYDDNFVAERGCRAARLYDKQLLLAVPLTHDLNAKTEISMADLKNRRVMLVKENWNEYIDALRKELVANGVTVEDFDMYNISAFNRAAKENTPILTVEGWEDVHPLLKIVPTAWEYKIPFGIFYSQNPSKQVKAFIDTVLKITENRREN